MSNRDLYDKTILVIEPFYEHGFIRPTVGWYITRALLRRCSVVNFFLGSGYYLIDALERPSALSRILARRFDLTPVVPIEPDLVLVVEPGQYRVNLEKFRCPKVFWALDSQTHFQDHLENRIADYEWSFASFKPFVQRYREAGVKNVSWLPFACDKEIHRRLPAPEDYDVGFVGTITDEREKLLNTLKTQFKCIIADHAYVHKPALIYSACKTVVDFHQGGIGPNMRVFEALACGRLLVTDRFEGMDGAFAEGRHLVVYDNEHEMVEKIRAHLTDESLREQIARQGMQYVLKDHTYDARAETILKTVGWL